MRISERIPPTRWMSEQDAAQGQGYADRSPDASPEASVEKWPAGKVVTRLPRHERGGAEPIVL